MPHHRSPRLFVDEPLRAGAPLRLSRAQGHYLANVLRLGAGAEVLVFNGIDGEWRTRIAQAGRKAAVLECLEQTRAQMPPGDLHYLFAPLKQARLDYMVQKAAELGASRLRPVLTRHTVPRRVNLERMRANAIEAAEQCNLLGLPAIEEPQKLERVLAGWPAGRALVYCDEGAPVRSPLAALEALTGHPLAVLIGPEGGFAADEREMLRSVSGAIAISLGPRVLRADTAAVAALALVQAALGDWR